MKPKAAKMGLLLQRIAGDVDSEPGPNGRRVQYRRRAGRERDRRECRQASRWNAKSHCITDRPKADRRIRDEVDKGIVVRTWRVLIWSEKCFRLFDGPIPGRFVGVWRMGE